LSCLNGNKSITKYLIEKGADINIKDKFGNNPLTFACQNEEAGIVKCLIDHGAMELK